MQLLVVAAAGPRGGRRRSSVGLSRSDPTLDTIPTFHKTWKEKLKEPTDILQTEIIKDKGMRIDRCLVLWE